MTRIRTLEWVGLVGVLLWGGVLRFGWFGVNSFAFDEARLSLIALDTARGGNFAVLGMPSSVGVPNLPAAAWIYALPYAVSPDPLVATAFTGLVSLFAVFGVWWLGRASWGAWAALVAALFLASSPYSVLYARSVWAQNWLIPLAVAWAWTASQRSRFAIALNVFLAGFAFQVHFAGASLALGTLYLFMRFRWWRQIVPVLIGAGAALLTALPFVTHITPQVVEGYRTALGGMPQVDSTSLIELMRLALATDWNYLALGDVTLPDSITLALAVGALLIVGLSALVKIMRRVPLALLPEVTLVLLVVSPLFFLRHTTPVFVHYQLVALPALALIAGASAKLFRQRFWPPLMVVLMLIIAAVWSAQIGYSLDIAARQITPNGLGTPLGITRAVAASVPDDLPVLFFTHGDDTTVHGEAAVFDALWWGRDHRIINGEALLILPPYPAYLLATLAPFQAWEEIEAAGLARAVHEFPRREGEGPGFVATTFDGEALPQGFIAVEPVLLEHGVQLEGWKARMVGPRLRISTLWRVSALPPSGTYQQFHHLRTADTLEDQPLHVADVPISAHTWQMGDWLVVMADFFVDSSREYWVDVGHYMLSDMTRMTHADGDSVRLGPFTLP